MPGWNDLFAATAGASATLTGLIFVGISLNLKTILKYPALISRAFVSLTLLVCILTVSILLLVPQTSTSWIGIEILMVGIFVWIVVTATDFKSYKRTEREYKRSYFWSIVIDQFALLPYITSGLMLLFGTHGLNWIVASIVLSFIKSVFDAWVLLIEINR